MYHSTALHGLLSESPEAARAHVWLYDRANIYDSIYKLVARTSGSAPNDALEHARTDKFLLNPTDLDWTTAKICRVLQHYEVKWPGAISNGSIIPMFLDFEHKVLAAYQREYGPGNLKKGIAPFEGKTIDDMARYELNRVFRELGSKFDSKSAEERRKIAEQLYENLKDLPPDVQAKIRESTGIDRISIDAIMKSGSIAAIGTTLVGTVGFAGFAAYSSLSAFIAAAAGLAGMTLPFGVYTFAASALAMVANPFFWLLPLLGGGYFFVNRANRMIRSALAPIIVSTAIVAGSDDTAVSVDMTEWVEHVKSIKSRSASPSERQKEYLKNMFVGLV